MHTIQIRLALSYPLRPGAGLYSDLPYLLRLVRTPAVNNSSTLPRRAPRLRCFDAAKDINIPTPNIHFPRTPYAPQLPLLEAKPRTRDLLMFYAGWNYGSRVRRDARTQSCCSAPYRNIDAVVVIICARRRSLTATPPRRRCSWCACTKRTRRWWYDGE